MSKKDQVVAVRIDPTLLERWRELMRYAEAHGAITPKTKPNLSHDINEALRTALMIRDEDYSNAVHVKHLAMLSGAINGKAIEMAAFLCENLGLEFETKSRPDGHIELVFGDRGSYVLPREYFEPANRTEGDKSSARLMEFMARDPAAN